MYNVLLWMQYTDAGGLFFICLLSIADAGGSLFNALHVYGHVFDPTFFLARMIPTDICPQRVSPCFTSDTGGMAQWRGAALMTPEFSGSGSVFLPCCGIATMQAL